MKKYILLFILLICFGCQPKEVKTVKSITVDTSSKNLKKEIVYKKTSLMYDTLEFNKNMEGELLSEKFKSSQSKLNFYKKFIKTTGINKKKILLEKHTKTEIKYLGKITDLKNRNSYHIITNFMIMGIGQMLSPRGRSEVAFVDETQHKIIIYNLSMPDELPKFIKDNILFFQYEKTKIGISISGGLPPELCLPEIGCY